MEQKNESKKLKNNKDLFLQIRCTKEEKDKLQLNSLKVKI